MRTYNTHILRGLLLATFGAAAAGAATLIVGNPVLLGPPDSTVGWGFTIESTPLLDGSGVITPWLLITFADFAPNDGTNQVGVFTKFITQPPNSNVVIGPDAGNGEINPWSQAFDDGLMTGIGSYHINDFQTAGDNVGGTIELLYDMYRVSPDDPSFDSSVDTIALGQTLSAPAAVIVTNPPLGTPEPGTASLLALGCGLVALGRSRRAGRRPDR